MQYPRRRPPHSIFIEGFRTPATVQAASLRSAGIRNPQQTATYEHLFHPSSARASTVGGMVRKRLPGLPTTVILFEPSVGLPTSADGPHPRREGFDDGRLRTMGHRDEIKPVAGQSERMRLRELSAP